MVNLVLSYKSEILYDNYIYIYKSIHTRKKHYINIYKYEISLSVIYNADASLLLLSIHWRCLLIYTVQVEIWVDTTHIRMTHV